MESSYIGLSACTACNTTLPQVGLKRNCETLCNYVCTARSSDSSGRVAPGLSLRLYHELATSSTEAIHSVLVHSWVV